MSESQLRQYRTGVRRAAFRWGGFPFWHYAPQSISVPFTYRPNFEKLLPLLREGLVAL